MKNELKITLVQTDNHWENIELNLQKLSEKLSGLQETTDLLLLPELFSTGFTMSGANVSETMEGLGVSWMKDWATKLDCLVAGSLLINEGDKLFNRFIAAFPSGEIKYSDKRHLFSYAGEHKVFEQGNERITFEYRGFKICPLICYDLRFPVWSRNTENFDLLLYVANWPDARMLAWDTLLRARAIENLCYVAGVNRVGVDNNQLVYVGHTSAYDAMGASLLNSKASQEAIYYTTLEKAHIASVREKFSFLDDRDRFEMK